MAAFGAPARNRTRAAVPLDLAERLPYGYALRSRRDPSTLLKRDFRRVVTREANRAVAVSELRVLSPIAPPRRRRLVGDLPHNRASHDNAAGVSQYAGTEAFATVPVRDFRDGREASERAVHRAGRARVAGLCVSWR